MKKFVVLLCLALALGGCASGKFHSSAASARYPIDIHSKIQLSTDLTFMPSLSGYYLPAGIYNAAMEDADGVYFKVPKGAKSLSPTGSVEVGGGIYLPKQEGHGVRGYVYLDLPRVGRPQYFLSDDFFSTYGKNWHILKEPIESPELVGQPKVETAETRERARYNANAATTLERQLQMANEVELYSIEPRYYYSDEDVKKDPRTRILFFPATGKALLRDKATIRKLGAALAKVIRDRDVNYTLGCFNPRHALRWTSNGIEITVLICFECGSARVEGIERVNEVLLNHGSLTIEEIFDAAGLHAEQKR